MGEHKNRHGRDHYGHQKQRRMRYLLNTGGSCDTHHYRHNQRVDRDGYKTDAASYQQLSQHIASAAHYADLNGLPIIAQKPRSVVWHYRRVMSALGHKRTYAPQKVMSAARPHSPRPSVSAVPVNSP